jgi:hypothetical protein
LHKVYYLVDDDMSEEKLWTSGDDADKGTGKASLGLSRAGNKGSSNGGATVWQMLDETRQEKSIGLKKRSFCADENGTTAASGQGSATPLKKPCQSSPAAAKYPRSVSAMNKIVDKTITVDCPLCSFIVAEYSKKQSQPFFTQSSGIMNKNSLLLSQFSEVIKRKYGANCKRSAASQSPMAAMSPSSSRGVYDAAGGGAYSTDDSICVTVYGGVECVDAAVKFVEESKTSFM